MGSSTLGLIVVGFAPNYGMLLAGSALTGLGSAIFTVLSEASFPNADGSRVAAQIVSGIGFLGAGAIFRSEQKWYALAFDCTLNDDLSEVTAFTFRLGPDVTTVVLGSGSKQPAG